MPFDALVQSPSDTLDTLPRFGLVPVPQEVLETYKATVKANFLAQPGLPERARREARWREYNDAQFRPTKWSDMFAWARTATGRPVPSAVRAIAEETQQRATERGVTTHEKVIGWFDRDPYVLFRWVERGQWHSACLAIWDNGEVRHIAKLI